MANLDQIIDYTKLYQDVELATAIGQFKQDPIKLQQFLQSQQDKVYKDVITQKDSTFNKVYGDLNRASTAQESMLMYNKRNAELLNLNNKIYETQKNSADSVTYDKDLANRKYEMNEWTVNNKKDTLFVFSMLFIMLSGLVLITVLWRLNLISSSLWLFLGAPLIVIFILVVIYRSQYTDVLRNKRYWNKKIFEGKYGKIEVPICPQALEGIKSGISSMQQGISTGIASTRQTLIGATENIGKGITQVSQAMI